MGYADETAPLINTSSDLDVFPAFIGYRYKDGMRYAKQLSDAAAREGICTFFDGALPLDWESHLAPRVQSLLHACDVYIMLVTDAFVEDVVACQGWVYRELAAAQAGRAQVVGVDLTSRGDAASKLAPALGATHVWWIGGRGQWLTEACAAILRRVSKSATEALAATCRGCAACFEPLPAEPLLNELAVRVHAFLNLAAVFGAAAGEHVDARAYFQLLRLGRLAGCVRYTLSNQGFVSYPIYHRTNEAGELQSYLRVQVWDGVVRAALCDLDFCVHSHQLPMRSYILRGAILNEEFESRAEGDEYAEFELRWDGSTRHTVDHDTSVITNSGRTRRIRTVLRELTSAGGTYTVPMGTLHRSTPQIDRSVTMVRCTCTQAAP